MGGGELGQGVSMAHASMRRGALYRYFSLRPTYLCPPLRRCRVGVHSGPVVSGLVGQRNPRFCLFGGEDLSGVMGGAMSAPGIYVGWLPAGCVTGQGEPLHLTLAWTAPTAAGESCASLKFCSSCG